MLDIIETIGNLLYIAGCFVGYGVITVTLAFIVMAPFAFILTLCGIPL